MKRRKRHSMRPEYPKAPCLTLFPNSAPAPRKIQRAMFSTWNFQCWFIQLHEFLNAFSVFGKSNSHSQPSCRRQNAENGFSTWPHDNESDFQCTEFSHCLGQLTWARGRDWKHQMFSSSSLEGSHASWKIIKPKGTSYSLLTTYIFITSNYALSDTRNYVTPNDLLISAPSTHPPAPTNIICILLWRSHFSFTITVSLLSCILCHICGAEFTKSLLVHLNVTRNIIFS